MESTVNERVKLLRSTLKLSQNEFANRIGVSSVGVWKLESGEGNPRQTTLNSICSTFGVSKEWLINGIGELEFSIAPEKEIVGSWSEKAFEAVKEQNNHLVQEIEFLRKLLLNVTGQQVANFNDACDLASLCIEKSITSVRAVA